MPDRSFSEKLFEQLCSSRGISCWPIQTKSVRTPDFEVRLGDARVICEIKQIDPNDQDLADVRKVRAGHSTGRYVPNRLRAKLKNVSGQLRATCDAGGPTLLVVYDNTPFKIYSTHRDVVQALFGEHSVIIGFPKEPDGKPVVSEPFFGGNRGLTPHQNSSVSAVGILDGGPVSECTLRVYHNPFASVVLDCDLLEVFPVKQVVRPGDRAVCL